MDLADCCISSCAAPFLCQLGHIVGLTMTHWHYVCWVHLSTPCASIVQVQDALQVWLCWLVTGIGHQVSSQAIHRQNLSMKASFGTKIHTKIVLEKHIRPCEGFVLPSALSAICLIVFGSCWDVTKMTKVLMFWFQLARPTCRSCFLRFCVFWRCYSMASAGLLHCTWAGQWWGFRFDAKQRTICSLTN